MVVDCCQQKMCANRPAGSKRKQRARHGFTLIELLVVMAIIGLLLSIAAPRYFASIDKAKEIALHETLRVTRSQIDKYYADRGRYPLTLNELVTDRYLQSVPIDPLTESPDSWVVVAPSGGENGVADIKSGAPGSARDGMAFAEF
jgi:general secretion pathway protein G